MRYDSIEMPRAVAEPVGIETEVAFRGLNWIAPAMDCRTEFPAMSTVTTKLRLPQP
jgi:hypothetical protein